MATKTHQIVAVLGAALLILGLTARAGAGPKYFKDTYDHLQLKACTLQARGSLASFNSSDATIQTIAQAKTGVLDNFYTQASSTYGKNDVDGASTVLKNEARLNRDLQQFKKPAAQEALYNAEATLKYFFEKDKASGDSNRPPLAAGFESSIPTLIVQAEAAFDAGKYGKMRKFFYHALWIAYPVTSKSPCVEPGDN